MESPLIDHWLDVERTEDYKAESFGAYKPIYAHTTVANRWHNRLNYAKHKGDLVAADFATRAWQITRGKFVGHWNAAPTPTRNDPNPVSVGETRPLLISYPNKHGEWFIQGRWCYIGISHIVQAEK